MSNSSTLLPIADRIGQAAGRIVSISYLGLMREDQGGAGGEARWHDWYDYFPWEDHRAGAPAIDRQADGAAAARLGETAPSRPT